MPASALCALITTDCRAPCVANDKLAEKDAALATT
jgi:hypothetical protein